MGSSRPKATGDEEAFAATSLPTLVQMVGSGLGVTYLPAMAVEAGLTSAAHVACVTCRPTIPAARSWWPGAPAPVVGAEGRLLAETLREA